MWRGFSGLAGGFIFKYLPNTCFLEKQWTSSFPGAIQMGQKASGLWLIHPYFQKTGREALGEGEDRGGSLLAIVSTHCSTERVRLAAKASAMDLAPSSLILLLWRLWRQGRGVLLKGHKKTLSGGLNPDHSVTSAQGGQHLTSVRRGLDTTCPHCPPHRNWGTVGPSLCCSGLRFPLRSLGTCLLIGDKVPIVSG